MATTTTNVPGTLFKLAFECSAVRRTLTVTSAAQAMKTDVPSVISAAGRLWEASLLDISPEPQQDDVDMPISGITASSALSSPFAGKSWQNAVSAYRTAATAAHAPAQPEQSPVVKQSHKHDPAPSEQASRQAAQRTATTAPSRTPILLSDHGKGKDRTIVTTTDTRYLQDYSQHKYERSSIAQCVLCARFPWELRNMTREQWQDAGAPGMGHTIGVPLCSRCYNRARIGAEKVFGTRAVVSGARAAQFDESKMVAFVEASRDHAGFVVHRALTPKQAARILSDALSRS